MGRSPLSICPSLSFRVRTASRDTGRPPETKQAQDSPGAKKPGALGGSLGLGKNQD